MRIVLFESEAVYLGLKPLTLTRSTADLRTGIYTQRERWRHWLPEYAIEIWSAQSFFSTYKHCEIDTLYVSAAWIPSEVDKERILALKENQGFTHSNESELLALRTSKDLVHESLNILAPHSFSLTPWKDSLRLLKRPWDLFINARFGIETDFFFIKKQRKSVELTDPHTKIYGADNIFIEEGAVVQASILNAEKGVIYIGKNAHIEEGSIVRGALALCEGATLNTGAKMRGDSIIGPYSKVGGEVSNSVIWGYSNKGHDGFLGNSVLGAWCNLGADTNTSNLKNNYSTVSVYNYISKNLEDSKELFCGLLMGDHSKSGINTMFNTGTVVGVGCNVFGANFPPKYIPSFSWGNEIPFDIQDWDKFLETAKRVLQRRNKTLDSKEILLLKSIFDKEISLRKI